MDRKLKSMLSLCRKAGYLAAGSEACVKVMRSGEAKLLLICGDASDGTKKMLLQKAFHYKTPYISVCTISELDSATGCGNRAAAAVTDGGFADRIAEAVKSYENNDINLSGKNPEVDLIHA